MYNRRLDLLHRVESREKEHSAPYLSTSGFLNFEIDAHLVNLIYDAKVSLKKGE